MPGWDNEDLQPMTLESALEEADEAAKEIASDTVMHSGYAFRCEAMVALAAEIRRLQALTKRQPIATAPMDGTAVDLWSQYTNDGTLEWMRWPECKWIAGRWQYVDWDYGGYVDGPQDATHWTAIASMGQPHTTASTSTTRG